MEQKHMERWGPQGEQKGIGLVDVCVSNVKMTVIKCWMAREEEDGPKICQLVFSALEGKVEL